MLGAEIVEIDYRPYREVAALLYNGPWVAERLVATRDILAARPNAVNGVVRDILHNATRLTAVDVFQGNTGSRPCWRKPIANGPGSMRCCCPPRHPPIRWRI
ncbi:hypothetical protein RAA17_18740 [Komagataeibacter rhaeticus]|nr:hypothetical protein [Komagataeibacter rhaeticus]